MDSENVISQSVCEKDMVVEQHQQTGIQGESPNNFTVPCSAEPQIQSVATNETLQERVKQRNYQTTMGALLVRKIFKLSQVTVLVGGIELR